MIRLRLCAVCSMENWLGSSLNQVQGWNTVRESYSIDLEQGPLPPSPSLHLVPAGVATYTLSFQGRHGGLERGFVTRSAWLLRPPPRKVTARPWQDCTHGWN